jgi:hypothetical protein
MWMTECSMFPFGAHALALSAVLEILIPESLAALVQLMRNPSQQLVSLVVFPVNALSDLSRLVLQFKVGACVAT